MASPPALRHIPAAALPALPLPTQKIHTDADVAAWTATTGYADYLRFLGILNAAIVGVALPYTPPAEIEVRRHLGARDGAMTQVQAVSRTIAMLDELERWIGEIPPLPTPQRFGNLAFRQWGARLEQETPALLAGLLPAELHAAIPHLAPYLLTSFGSFARMDYGTGHEAAFALLLCALALLRVYPLDDAPAVPRALALVVFPRYVALTWALQDAYRLEPAGSHGVWGLDDSSFLGYWLGSAQLLGASPLSPPSPFLFPSLLPTDGPHADSPVPPAAVLPAPPPAPPLPPVSLYHTHLARITQVKTGPFHEHSSQLYNIAMGVRGWRKVNSGLAKMYVAEVLGKRVVVQHLPLGGLIAWDPPAPSAATAAAPDTTHPAWGIPPTAVPPKPTLPPMPAPRRRGTQAGAGDARRAPPPPPPPEGGTRAPWA
ncbi:hypothetical protein HWV62_18632 [Athelia sp. TMB]|nr:hypothetical protein HWV62_18632 [Athelia sp. TMB]